MRRVAIVYTNPLFAQGISRLLEAEPRVQVVSVDTREVGAKEEVRRLGPQVVIVEHDGDEHHLGKLPVDLLDLERRSLLILVGLRDSGMQAFYNRRVIRATPEALLELVLGSPTRK